MHHIRKRGFEKISFQQFQKDFNCTSEFIYNQIKLPRRATQKSSGYDIYSPYDLSIKPNETVKLPTALKSYMQDDEFLAILPRSSVGWKYKITLENTVANIDADYYNNEKNEGHIFLKFTNNSEHEWVVKSGEAIFQAIFINYLVTDDDKPVAIDRVGGIGSTNDKKDN